MTVGKAPFGDGVGPFAVRGDATGISIHKGYIIAEWGEPGRVDMTFSVTKSFLSTVIGLAVDLRDGRTHTTITGGICVDANARTSRSLGWYIRWALGVAILEGFQGYIIYMIK